MKKRIVILSLAACLLICCLAACNATNKNTLRVGTSLSFPPYEYMENNKIVGVDIDIMQEIANQMGKELVVETMEFDDLFDALQYHKIDVIAAGLTVTDERKQSMNFTVSYASGEQKILVKNDVEVNNLSDLKSKDILIGVEKGTTGFDLAAETFNTANIREYDDATRMMDALESGIVSAVVIDVAPATVYASRHTDLRTIDIDTDYEEYALALAKDSEYYEQINSILQDMIERGTVDDIIQSYNSIN